MQRLPVQPVYVVTIHGALHPAAGHPADNFTVSGIQVYTPFRSLPSKCHWHLATSPKATWNGLDALQFAAGQAVNCNYVYNNDITNLSRVLRGKGRFYIIGRGTVLEVTTLEISFAIRMQREEFDHG